MVAWAGSDRPMTFVKNRVIPGSVRTEAGLADKVGIIRIVLGRKARSFGVALRHVKGALCPVSAGAANDFQFVLIDRNMGRDDVHLSIR